MKNLNFTRFIKGVTCAAVFGLLSSQAAAAPIDGSLSWFGGDWTATPNVATTTTADFTTNVGGGLVMVAIGDFAPFLSFLDPLDVWDLDFTVAAQPLWDGGGFSFATTSLSVLFQSGSRIDLSGLGIVSGNGFDPTVAQWTETLNEFPGAFSFSGSSSTSPVPNPVSEPGMLGLLGLSLLGVALSRRKTELAKK